MFSLIISHSSDFYFFLACCWIAGNVPNYPRVYQRPAEASLASLPAYLFRCQRVQIYQHPAEYSWEKLRNLFYLASLRNYSKKKEKLLISYRTCSGARWNISCVIYEEDAIIIQLKMADLIRCYMSPVGQEQTHAAQQADVRKTANACIYKSQRV